MDDEFKIWCGNLPSEITEALLYELCIQAGPVNRIHIPKDKETKAHCNYGFVTFNHKSSIQYAISLLNGIQLYGRNLVIKSKSVQATPQIESPNNMKFHDLETFGSNMLSDYNNRGYQEHNNHRNYNRNGRDDRRNEQRPYNNKHDHQARDYDRNNRNYNNRSGFNRYEQNEHYGGNNRNSRRNDNKRYR